MYMEHDSHSALFRTPFGAAVCGTRVTLRLLLDTGGRDAAGVAEGEAQAAGGGASQAGAQTLAERGVVSAAAGVFDVRKTGPWPDAVTLVLVCGSDMAEDSAALRTMLTPCTPRGSAAPAGDGPHAAAALAAGGSNAAAMPASDALSVDNPSVDGLSVSDRTGTAAQEGGAAGSTSSASASAQPADGAVQHFEAAHGAPEGIHAVRRELPMAYAGTLAGAYLFEASFLLPQTAGQLFYHFLVSAGGRTAVYGNNRDRLGGVGALWPDEGSVLPYQITVYDASFHAPRWLRGAVVYHIFVDRFAKSVRYDAFSKKSGVIRREWGQMPYYDAAQFGGTYLANDCFGGSLAGIMDKLDYLCSLGVNVLYLSPIFTSPTNHKYDTADYLEIDPMLGDAAIFRQLCQAARARGMYVLLDGVFNHTGADSRYFNRYGSWPDVGAYQSKASPYYPWYSFSAWPDKYASWWGFETLPQVNEDDASYRAFVLNGDDAVVKKWIRLGAAGWRLDVADELPDSFIFELREQIKPLRPGCADQLEDTDSGARSAGCGSVKEAAVQQHGGSTGCAPCLDYGRADAYGNIKEAVCEPAIIGEVWEDASNKESYGVLRRYLCGRGLDGVMNYPLRAAVLAFVRQEIEAAAFNARIFSLYENYPREAFEASLSLLSTHDTVRALTALSDAPPEHTLSRSQQAAYRLTDAQRTQAVAKLRIAAAMQMLLPGAPCIYYGDEAGMEGYGDPFCRQCYPWDAPDEALRRYYRSLTALRRRFAALRYGSLVFVYGAASTTAFLRICDQACTLVVVNAHDTYGHNAPLELGRFGIFSLTPVWASDMADSDDIAESGKLPVCAGPDTAHSHGDIADSGRPSVCAGSGAAHSHGDVAELDGPSVCAGPGAAHSRGDAAELDGPSAGAALTAQNGRFCIEMASRQVRVFDACADGIRQLLT